MEDDGSVPRHSCLKLEPRESQPIFVKGTWFDSRFDLSITDGLNAWVCHASEDAVRDRAAQWDQPVSEYVSLAERYLGFQHPDSVYGFTDAGDGHKREGTKLEWRWKCQPSPNSKETTAAVLDFLMDANVGLSEEVVRKTQSFERLKVEAEKCLTQSEKIANEKMEFETAVYAKEMDIPLLACEEARAISLRMYDASREKISNQKAPEQIKAISQKLSTLALEEEKQSVSKHFMKKKEEEERRKKKKEKKKSKVPHCACCASYKGKMKKEIHIWVKATKKELRRLYPELEGQWRRQQEVRRKNHLEMLAAYKKRQEEEEEEELEELEEEQKEEEIEEEELEEGPEEKQKRIEKEKEMEQQKQKEEEEFAAFLAREEKQATESIVRIFSAYTRKGTFC